MRYRQRAPQSEESETSAPLWIVSYADMMSLLMAFFVLLSTFSTFGPDEAEKLQKTVRATLAPNYYGGWYVRDPTTAMGPQMPAAGQPEKGSEKPTLQECAEAGLQKEMPADDFRAYKIFLIESRTLFWGTGTALSQNGREVLDTLASFVSQVPGRLVLSEDGPGLDAEQRLRRVITVVNYLTARGIPKDRCSLALQGMSPDESFQQERVLEVVLLEAGLYQ